MFRKFVISTLGATLLIWATFLQPAFAQVTPEFNTPVRRNVGAVYLTWDAFPAAQTYEIYWSTSPGVTTASNVITIPSAITLGYWHTGLTGGTPYYYRIRALDQFSNWTLLSTEVAITPAVGVQINNQGGDGDGHAQMSICFQELDGQADTPAYNQLTVYPGFEENRLFWGQYPGAVSYELTVGNNQAGPFSIIDTIIGLDYIHDTLIPTQAYYYRIRPLLSTGCYIAPSVPVEGIPFGKPIFMAGGNGDGHAQNSECLSDLDGNSTPPSFPGLTLYPGFEENFIFWQQFPGASGYDLEFSTSKSGPFSVLVSNTNSLDYAHTGLSGNTKYYYRLQPQMTTGCPILYSTIDSAIAKAKPTFMAGGDGDGHANEVTCVLNLDGASAAPSFADITVYPSVLHNLITWPQEPGAIDYDLEYSLTGLAGSWTVLNSSTNLEYRHQPASLSANQTYFYRVQPNLPGGCPLNPSAPQTAPGIPQFDAIAGGLGDGHSNDETCVLKLNGNSAAPKAADITVYASTMHNLVTWPQEPGALDYDLEYSLSGNPGSWSILHSSTALEYQHQPASLQANQQYFYRVQPNLPGGCPLNPSATQSAYGIPQNDDISGGDGDGHSTYTTCLQKLGGFPDTPNAYDITIYSHSGRVGVYWPQSPGATSYLLERSADGSIWDSVLSSTSLSYEDLNGSAPDSFLYRVKPELNTGCPVFPSVPQPGRFMPNADVMAGGEGDGHAHVRSCTFVRLNQSDVDTIGLTANCQGGTVMLVASPAFFYTWYRDSIPIPSSNTDTLVVTQSGSYTVDVFNIFSCSATSLATDIVINAAATNPDPISISNSSPSCGPVELTVPTPPQPNNYYWQGDNPSGTSTLLPATSAFIADTSGTYYLRNFDTSGCWSIVSSAATVVVPPYPSDITPQTNSINCTVGGLSQWNHLVAPDGKVFASIQDSGQRMGNLNATVYVTGDSINRFNGVDEFLSRHFVVQVDTQPNIPVRMRIYFTDTEYQWFYRAADRSPSASDDFNSLNDLVVTKYQGPTEDGIYDLSDATDVRTLAQISNGWDFNGHYIEFLTPSFSEFWVHPANFTPLPVELSAFDAVCLGNSVELKWSTELEIENDYFEIQRSANGQTWEPVGVISGAGNSTDQKIYVFTDNSPGAGEHFYRLMQVDWDSEVHFSDVLGVECIPVGSDYPVWISGWFKSRNVLDVSFTWPLDSEGVFTLMDINGKVLDSWKGSLKDGENKLRLGTKDIAAGMYLLEINDGRFKLSRQIPLVD